ncbi:MAG: hypothetical protein WC841_00350 [Candidatus Shapirobacteria bacterium]|jgi:hypothetical protein
MYKTPKNKRNKIWAEFEADIQSRATQKDKKFILSGKWKKFIRFQDGFKVYAVDGTWIRNNISIMFGHGGHGYVHEFIPQNEIWIATHHPGDSPKDLCGCKNVSDSKKVSQNFFDSTTLHEITEFREMKKGKSFKAAHHTALEKEIESGLLPDPYTEI